MQASATAASSPAKAGQDHQPVAIIVMGMAGSGKTTVVQRILAEAERFNKRIFAINLDPAVGAGLAAQESDEGGEEEWTGLPYDPNIDIRDSINYRDVMKSHGLGPNGAILTSLNLFSTRFNEVVSIIERRKSTIDYFLFDTPGQIEVFTWSASGSIITETLASIMPTVLIYVVDTPRSKSPTTFTSNMLYACSIMFRTRLPMLLVFNKADAEPFEPLIEWLSDIDAFQEAVDQHLDTEEYMVDLTRSLGLVLTEFYETLKTVGFSAATGQGIGALFDSLNDLVDIYNREYMPELEARQRSVKKRS